MQKSSCDTPASQCFSLNEALNPFNEANGRVSILLSPGFSSFDQFRNYEERGETFNQCPRIKEEVCHFDSRTAVLDLSMQK